MTATTRPPLAALITVVVQLENWTGCSSTKQLHYYYYYYYGSVDTVKAASQCRACPLVYILYPV